MKRSIRLLSVWSLIAVVWLAPMTVSGTALDRYVAKADSSYGYSLYHVDQTLLYTSYFIDMVSQQWRSILEVDRPVWEHELQITIPAVLHSASPRTALLIVNGGSNGGSLNTETGAAYSTLAALSGSIVATINQVPNQPLYFADEGQPRSEDAIIAYSFDKFLATGDPEWPVLLPMTKAVVRAMDTVQSFLAAQSVPVDDFIVLGGSKRGWATWLAAAVDRRVKAIVPISIDLLNTEMQFIHQWEVYGFYAPAVADYVAFDIPCRLMSDRGQELLAMVDPYAYRERYTMPKLVINSAGDQFFVTDSSRFYYADLPSPKSLRYTFNTDHRQGEDENALLDLAVGALLWVDDVNRGRQSPRFSWFFASDGSIRVQPVDQPDQVYLVQATNTDARDFRLESIGEAWQRTPLAMSADGSYAGYVAPPPSGYTAFALELAYDSVPLAGSSPVRQVFTTGVRITPDTLPFQGTACPSSPMGRTNISGTVALDGTPVCALVLANGRHVFSCGLSQGRFQTAIPLDQDGGATLFAFADGLSQLSLDFAPTGAPIDLEMRYAAVDEPSFSMPVTSVTAADRPNWATVAGTASTGEGTPVCALVLANGQYMFSCGEDLGRYQLTVPLDADGAIDVFGFADGFSIWKERLVPGLQ